MFVKIPVLILAVVAAFIPVIVWFYIIRRKNREHMMPRFILTFMLSGIGAFIAFKYEPSLRNYLHNIGIYFFLVYVVTGALIEYFKNMMVRVGGFKYFKNVDDVMDLSFASALGFTFFENIIHFYIGFSGVDLLLITSQPETIIGPVKMLKYFLFREFFVLPVHLCCSGFFGYFYAMGIFSGEDLQKANRKNVFYLLPHLFAKLLFIPDRMIFKMVKIMQGTIISVSFYALFFAIVEKDPMISDILALGGWTLPVDEKLIPFIAFAFFNVGTIILFNLMDLKKQYESRGQLKISN